MFTAFIKIHLLLTNVIKKGRKENRGRKNKKVFGPGKKLIHTHNLQNAANCFVKRCRAFLEKGAPVFSKARQQTVDKIIRLL
ncbi:MAG: hypothetical protein LUG96_11825, partial [Tannerellaceae bacterium]|nr:hypothetical protein [Tannerellaceae bacterium]